MIADTVLSCTCGSEHLSEEVAYGGRAGVVLGQHDQHEGLTYLAQVVELRLRGHQPGVEAELVACFLTARSLWRTQKECIG